MQLAGGSTVEYNAKRKLYEHNKKKKPTAVLIPSHFSLVIFRVAAHDIMDDIVISLEDLVEIDCLILDLEGHDCVLSANAYEELKGKRSHDWEAFNYLQERMHDVRISEQARNTMHEIIK